MSRKATIYSVGIIGLILATIPLLGADNVPFLKWWLMVLILGLGYYPLGAVLFSSLRDRGYIFSKVLGSAWQDFLPGCWWSAARRNLPAERSLR